MTGRLVPDVFVDAVVEQAVAENPFRAMLPPLPPLTRRQRIVGRLRGYRWRVSEAWSVLRGTHECGDDE